jgi:8-oxo-dGTP pyrophosphatase MutT (NUDIX family)
VVSTIILLALKIFTKFTGRPRVRVLVTNEHGEVLLLRGYVGHRFWSFPGGGVGRHESLTAAARRELHEETGILVDETELEFIRTLKRPEFDIPFTAPLFKVTVKQSSLPTVLFSPHEIIEVAWFMPDKLPEPLSRIARYTLEK